MAKKQTEKTDNEKRVNIRVRISTRDRLKVNAAIKTVDMIDLVDELSRGMVIDVKALEGI